MARISRSGKHGFKLVVHDGQDLAMKLVGNMLIQVNTVAVAEALVLGLRSFGSGAVASSLMAAVARRRRPAAA